MHLIEMAGFALRETKISEFTKMYYVMMVYVNCKTYTFWLEGPNLPTDVF